MNKLLKVLIILPLFLLACTKKEDPVVVVPPKTPQITDLSGGIMKIKANETFKELITDQIVLDTGDLVPENTAFRVVSDELLISTDRADWLKDLLVFSQNGTLTISVKPSTAPGLYRINVYPIASDKIKFSSNLSARFFIEVVPGDPFIIQNMAAEKYEDLAPYNNVKELNESWMISANPDLVTYISVGPIQDKFGNPISEGNISLVVSEGTVISTNPSPIADGFAYFSYRPTTNVRDLTVTANLGGVTGVTLNKSSSMKLVKPQLEFMSVGDFSGMYDGEVRELALVLKNKGSQSATNLDISIAEPFVVLPEQADSCKQRMTLRSQETCIVRVKYTRQIALTQNGYLQVVGQPSNFISATATLPLIVSNVEPPKLILSQSVLSFPQTQCGLKTTLDVFVTNTGSFPATNVNVTQPAASVVGQVPYFKIILPPEDSGATPDVNAIIDCGNVFPPGRKCRVRIEFQPLSTLPPNPVSGLINADSVPSLVLSLSGISVPGMPTGDIPISFLTYGSLMPTNSMFASNGQKTMVRVGPIADSCNNPVANGSIVTATVTGGTLSSMVGTTNNGYADFIWNSLSKPELLGNQTITVTSNNYSKQATLTFQGVNLSLSGSTDWGQVIIEKPRDLTYQVTNLGNVRAENLTFNFTAPLQLVSEGTCAGGVPAGGTCSFVVGARPLENQDYPASIFVASSTLGVNQASLNNILIVGRNKPVLTFDATKYLFNDGATAPTLTRTLTLTNGGPSVSKATVISVDSPYVIQSNNCPVDLGVQQTCQIVITVPKSSSLSAGAKTIYVNNEVEDSTVTAQFAFGELKYSDEVYTTKKYYCVGPYKIKSIGQNNEQKNLPSSSVVVLDSITQKVLFYSENTCNSKILSVTIPANASESSTFYIRSIAAESNTLTGTYGVLNRAERTILFADIRNDVLTFKPAIALKNMACIMCHSSVKGNIVTDFGFNPTTKKGDFFIAGATDSGLGNYIDTSGYAGGGWGGFDMGMGTSYIEGTIYVPKLQFNPHTKGNLEYSVAAGKGSVGVANGSGGRPGVNLYKASAQTSFASVADYLNAGLVNRTASYLSFLLNWGGGSYAKDPAVSPNNLYIRELKNVNISWPATNKITSFLDDPGTFKYYKWEDTSPDLANFGNIGGRYFGNLNSAQNMVCDGDIFVDGVVFLNALKLETTNGCRIYSTKTVFIQSANSSVNHRQGIEYVGGSANANLQISSSKGIMLGLGQCPNVGSFYPDYQNSKGYAYASRYGLFGYRLNYDDFPHFGTTLGSLKDDYDKVVDNNNNSLLYDAGGPVGGCAGFSDATYGSNRRVDFSNLLLNAPRIDSRYTGNFEGVLIGGTSIWALGKFSYKYDNVFDSVPILPFFTPDVFFTVDDCVVNGIDQALSKDTNYKACPN